MKFYFLIRLDKEIVILWGKPKLTLVLARELKILP